MTPGQIAYEEDVRRKPLYHDGTPRKTWAQLPEWAAWGWERCPTPREYPSDVAKLDGRLAVVALGESFESQSTKSNGAD